MRLTRGRTQLVHYPGMNSLPDSLSPPVLNTSWTITADVELVDDKTSGMIVAHGGIEGGYGLYMRDGKPAFVYNFLGIEHSTIAAKDALPRGKATIVVDFAYDGGGMGKGGLISMTANGKNVAKGRLERTVPIKLSIVEGLDIGIDGGSAVDLSHLLPFAFTGKIEKVTYELEPEAKGETQGEVSQLIAAKRSR